jgi:ABC-type transport system involved in multi-copper enzyme maturation permease subunit
MKGVLLVRSLRDSWLLLLSCCLLVAGFVCLRLWIASKIKADAIVKLFSSALKMFANLLPVSIEDLASPLGRSAFSYEELPVILLLGLWVVTRGSDSIAGRVGSGTMEMLLAQPLRRIALVWTHSAVTLAGIVLLAAASFGGLAAGIALSEFDPKPELAPLVPATLNYVGLGVFLLGLSTFVSAVARTRSQAVAVVIGFYVVELALMILARISPEAKWMEKLTILTAYEPTMLTIGLQRDAAAYWPIFWQYNAWLVGLGLLLWATAAAIFCHRDVPAPL